MIDINSTRYWEGRFSSGDWEKKNGNRQSEYFASIAVNAFPQWLIEELTQNAWSVIDYGCAEGDGTAYIAKRFPSCRFKGIDISEYAIEKARNRFLFCDFETGSLLKEIQESDVIFTSNTLEHMKEPMKLLFELVQHSKKHSIFLLPLEDTSEEEEHFSIFRTEMFPNRIGEHFLSHFQISDARSGSLYWAGKQILLVYTHQAHRAPDAFNLGWIYRYNIQVMQDTNLEQMIHIRELEKEVATFEQRMDELKKAWEQKIEQVSGQLQEAHSSIHAWREDSSEKTKQLQIAIQSRIAFEEQCKRQNNELAVLYQHIENTRKSISYRCAAPIRFAGRIFRGLSRRIARLINLLSKVGPYTRQYGVKATFRRIKNHKTIEAERAQRHEALEKIAQNEDIWAALERWIDETPCDFIDIFGVPMGWNTPLFQRFQHISLQVGNIGGISFYGAHPQVDQDVDTYRFVTPTLCVVNLLDSEVADRFWRILDHKSKLKYVRVQSIDLATTIEKVKSYISRGYQIVYEYIDELTPQITGNIPKFVYDRHEYLLRNEDVTVVATSDKLFSQIKPYRKTNMLMLNNGVDYAHWHLSRSEVDCPEDIRHIVNQGKIIIGYHGALAQWIDYKLLCRLAGDERFILLLIGHKHDDRLNKSGLLKKKNVYYIGSKSYHELNRYCIFYDIAILPFVINDITLSVSPVKIFEYMAAEKPVVTYALPECQKYKSCLCAETEDEFVAQIEKAIHLKDDREYINQLRRDALDNTWISITEKMVQYVRDAYMRRQKLLAERQVLSSTLSVENKNELLEQMLLAPKYQDQAYCGITDRPYEHKEGDCKVIAYYLTQFHPDSHNELWWGKGVTEWNNVCRAVPQYVGHYQPRIPGELGYYDLRIMDNMKRQIELAKMYGIYGFSFYYYWFDGERLLEKPLEAFLKAKEIDFPFCVCWANENWTKRFDGTNQDILMEQPKSVESYRNVIHDMIRFLKDERYIEVCGKKLIIVYRPSLMPEHKRVLRYWREQCREQGLGELYIMAVKENMIDVNWLDEGFDAATEFHPGTLYTQCQNIANQMNFLRKDFAGEVFSYKDIVLKQKYFNYDYSKLYRAVMPMWDNTARRDHKGVIFDGSTPKLYKQWLKDVIRAGYARKDIEDNIIFINAWNEWGEGAYMEPDKRYGYAYLQATKEAIEETRD